MIVRQLSHTKGGSVSFRLTLSGTSQAFPAGPPPAPPGTVQSLATGKCLDLPGGQENDGTPTIQYDCHDGPNQQWNIEAAGETGYRIASRKSGKCVGIDPGHAVAGGYVVQSPCGRSPDQLWALDRAGNGYVLRNIGNHLCLDVPGGSFANGVKLVAWTCNGAINQIWRNASPAAP